MTSRYTEFRSGWGVVFASAIGIGLGMSPLPFYTIGVFASPLSQAFGWGMGQILSALMIFTVAAVFTSPIVGMLTDRYGSRRIVLTSIALFSLAMMSFSLLTGSIAQYLVTWTILAVAGAGTLPIAFTRAVNNWFHRSRGLALGLALVGTGLFGILAKQWAFFLIETIGWRLAYVGVGALPLLIAWPIAFLLFRDTSDPKVAARHKPNNEEAPGGMRLGRALKDWRLWLLAYAFIPISFAVGGPIPNLETLLGQKGFDTQDAVTLASLIGVAVIIGRVAGGFLLDYLWAPAVAAVILSLPALATFMLAQAELSFLFAAVAIMILGAAAGVEYDLMAYLVSRYFGMRHYATIYGFLYGFFALGAGFGPAVFGRAFEATGSYDSILMIASLLFLVGALPLLLLGKYRNFKAGSEEASDPSGVQ